MTVVAETVATVAAVDVAVAMTAIADDAPINVTVLMLLALTWC